MDNHWQEWAVYVIVGITLLIFLKKIFLKKKGRASACGDCACKKPAVISRRNAQP